MDNVNEADASTERGDEHTEQSHAKPLRLLSHRDTPGESNPHPQEVGVQDPGGAGSIDPDHRREGAIHSPIRQDREPAYM